MPEEPEDEGLEEELEEDDLEELEDEDDLEELEVVLLLELDVPEEE